MGTKLEYAINPLSYSSTNSILANQPGDWGFLRGAAQKEQSEHTNLLHIKISEMDGQIFDMQNIESIRKTMLMHEDIFRQQVRELHRLYDRQIKLTYELKKEATMTRKRANTSEIGIWQHQPIQERKQSFPGLTLADDPRDRGGSCSGENQISWTRPKGLNLETFAEEPPSTSIRADIIEWDHNKRNYSSRDMKIYNVSNSDGGDEEVDVELTLSIGCSSRKKRLKSNGQPKGCSLDLGSSDTNSNGVGGPCSSSALTKRDSREHSLGDSGLALSNSSGKLNLNIARSSWFAQDLSLKRT